mmetsp:Transcript_8303/g.21391  ORF Transcript_8303/g.21391 Transcript_8303/m.21391 type:complete len:241 (-) Transcript_8303:272-994(-)
MEDVVRLLESTCVVRLRLARAGLHRLVAALDGDSGARQSRGADGAAYHGSGGGRHPVVPHAVALDAQAGRAGSAGAALRHHDRPDAAEHRRLLLHELRAPVLGVPDCCCSGDGGARAAEAGLDCRCGRGSRRWRHRARAQLLRARARQHALLGVVRAARLCHGLWQLGRLEANGPAGPCCTGTAHPAHLPVPHLRLRLADAWVLGRRRAAHVRKPAPAQRLQPLSPHWPRAHMDGGCQSS